MTAPEVRSSYLEQVRQIAPATLVDRDAELAELAAFCTAPDGGPYAWWRAPAWSGKSALMSTFVLHPPPGVRIVSFFVTARLAGQHDRAAFVAVVLEQLAELLGQALPAYLTEATRDAHLLGLLAEAARACERQGERLVLVVDGLDEDRGVVAGDDAYSIAGLLPARPADGLRVVVSGRLHPPVPADVPGDHPLRDPAVVRSLATSPHAGDVRREAERELKRLLRGTAAEQDLLGLLTAAGGGLSGADLAALTGVPSWQIEDALHAVSGRTFTTRAAPGAPVYVLGHEELQRSAMAFLGERRLSDYRGRLHAWADGVRAAGWPAETSDYLLRGYPGLLIAAGDTRRLVALATDEVRHDRMLAVTGADNLAQVEVTAAQDLIVAAREPDLAALLRVAVQRDHLSRRNANLPTLLPAVWARLGQVARGEALARSITDPARQAVALADLAYAITDGERAALLAEQAAALALEITDQDSRSATLAELAEAAARTGRHRAATELVGEVAAAEDRSKAFAELAAAAARRGDPAAQQAYRAAAEDAALAIDDPRTRERTLSGLAEAAWAGGDHHRAAGLAGQIHPGGRTRALDRLAHAALRSGDVAGALTFADAIADPRSRTSTLRALVSAAIEAGRGADAAELATAIDDEAEQAEALDELARHVATGGDYDRAAALAAMIGGWRQRADTIGALAGLAIRREAYNAAFRLLDELDLTDDRADAVAELVRRAAKEDRDAAERLAFAAGKRADRAAAFGALVELAIEAGDLARAEVFADGISEVDSRSLAWRALVRAMAEAGDTDRAATVAARLTDPVDQAAELLTLVREALDRGDRSTARVRAESIVDPWQRARGLAELVRSAVEAGEVDVGAEIVEGISDPSLRAEALAVLARVAAEAGDLGRAATVAAEAEALGRSTVAGAAADGGAVMALAVAAATAGGDPLRRAIALARTSADLTDRALNLQSLAAVAATAGDPELAGVLRAETDAAVAGIPDPGDRSLLHAGLARQAATAGDHERALELALLVRVGDQQNYTVSTLVDLAIEAGDLDRAERLAAAIGDASHRGYILAQLADAAAAREEDSRAARVAGAIQDPMWQEASIEARAASAIRLGDRERARLLAEMVPGDTARDGILVELAHQAMDAGDLAGAAGIAGSVSSVARDDLVGEVARAAMFGGDLDFAAELARSMDEGFLRSQLFAELIRAALRADDLDRAVDLGSDADGDEPGEQTARLAWAAASAGDHELSLALAARVADIYHGGPVVADLIRLAARDGDLDRAAAFAELVDNADEQARALAPLAARAANGGDFTHAAALAARIVDPAARERAVTEIVRAAAAAGEPARAAELARGAGGPDGQARALLAIAETVDPGDAGPFLAQALTLTGWTAVVRTLAKIRPEVVDSVAADLLG
ncbi:P-loop domain-containing protein [Asanoa ferruginea]|uniref:hypothetical protein n=1 Tax=Asanoa ferruginea TaxID=53367 RepID=UPI000E22CA12|nr:hypothetical protein [Asanoa ferruginea]